MKPFLITCTLAIIILASSFMMVGSFAKRRGVSAAEGRRSLIASEYFRAGVASAVMVKARGLPSNAISYDDFVAACQKAWVAVNTNDVGVIK